MQNAYTWIKDTNTNQDRCVIDPNTCILNTKGEAVRYCSFERNKDKQVCKSQMSAEAQSAYRILGCYDSPDCGGNVSMDTYDTSFLCPEHELKKCSSDRPMNELRENCVELEDGTMPSSQVDQNYMTPKYCYLGRPSASYSTEKNPHYDPCGLSFRNNGIDLVPKACFNRHCCPGSFGSATR